MSVLNSIKSLFSTAKQAATDTIDSGKNAVNIAQGKITDYSSAMTAGMVGPTGPAGATGAVGPTGPTGAASDLSSGVTTAYLACSGVVSANQINLSSNLYITPVKAADLLPLSGSGGTIRIVTDTPDNINSKTLPIDMSKATVTIPVFWDGMYWRRTY